jgi:L-cysteine:1D-myo-inositol 2-amino-2-deoxy-alpha-D-glucopyranoside ligase
MVELANERGGNIADPNKRHPLDFVLWQTSAPDEPAWETMWGAGRPGWHIECSALALRELGTTIDLHGGGSDLIFPHHECERAQSEAATGVPFVRHWMHVAMVSMDGHKMSKSRGNLVFVDALRKEWDPRVIRLGLVAHHYRVEWEWNTNIMPDALARLQLWQSVSQDAGTTNSPASQELLAEVRDALDDDLNSPFALQLIDAAARAQVNVATSAALLGVQL